MEQDLCRDAVGQRAVIGIHWAYEQTRLCCRSKTVSSCCVYKRRGGQSVFYVQMSEHFFQPSSLLSSLSSQSPLSTHWDVKYSIQYIRVCVFVIVWMHVVGILSAFVTTGSVQWQKQQRDFRGDIIVCWCEEGAWQFVWCNWEGLETTWTERLWSRDDDAKRLSDGAV